MKKIFGKFFGFVLASIFVMLCLNINYSAVFDVPNTISITVGDVQTINSEGTFGNFVSANIDDNIISVGGEKIRHTNLYLKLFGIIPIRKIDAIIEEERQVYLGGIPLGFTINTKGLIVVGENKVSKGGGKSPFRTGDIITKINGVTIEEPVDIYSILEDVGAEPMSINLIRNGQEKEIVAIPQYDESDGEYKLGLWVRDDAQGIGTLTFVTKDGKFGALGHSINDYETGAMIPVKDGGIYTCNLVGINKAEKGKAGELRCLFSQSKNAYGSINSNTKSGVFGYTDYKDKLVDENLTAEIGSRLLVKLGKAKIVSAVSGIREEYDVEIIKAKYQPSSSDKSFVFRVIDKRLISLTGGIVQGMSGSPIVQNGKIIGAVTHVFLNDSTKGYGIYVDWMLDEI